MSLPIECYFFYPSQEEWGKIIPEFSNARDGCPKRYHPAVLLSTPCHVIFRHIQPEFLPQVEEKTATQLLKLLV